MERISQMEGAIRASHETQIGRNRELLDMNNRLQTEFQKTNERINFLETNLIDTQNIMSYVTADSESAKVIFGEEMNRFMEQAKYQTDELRTATSEELERLTQRIGSQKSPLITLGNERQSSGTTLKDDNII